MTVRNVSLAVVVAVGVALGGVARAGDIQMVNPNPPPAAAPVVTPVPVAPAPAPEPVVLPPAKQKVIHEDVESHNYMGTIALSALAGGLAGALVGGAIYFLSDNQTHPARIGYWAAGGVLVGTGVGLVQIVVQENRAETAVSRNFDTDPAPTFRLALYHLSF
jgi:uncharacterized protein YcfJ